MNDRRTASKTAKKYFNESPVLPASLSGNDDIHRTAGETPSGASVTKRTRARKHRPAPDSQGRHRATDSAVRAFVADLLTPKLGREIGWSVADLMTPKLIGKIRGLPRFKKTTRRSKT